MNLIEHRLIHEQFEFYSMKWLVDMIDFGVKLFTLKDLFM